MRPAGKKQRLFKNREEAARFLCGRLESYRGLNPLVLAIPRGGAPMGRILAEGLGGELDLALVHKIRAPGNPEYAIGAVGEGGLFYGPPYPQHLWIAKRYLDSEIQRQVWALELRRRFYTPGRSAISAANRVVLLVDDGMATGSTMLAVVREVERQRPAKVVVVAAVAPPEAVECLKQEADQVEVLGTWADFNAIHDFFTDFRQVSDGEVAELFRK